MHFLRRLRRYLPGERDFAGRYPVSDRPGRLHRLRRLRRGLPCRRDQARGISQAASLPARASLPAQGFLRLWPRKIAASIFKRGYSSSGRALEWHSRGGRFESVYLHQVKIIRTCWFLPIGSDLFFGFELI